MEDQSGHDDGEASTDLPNKKRKGDQELCKAVRPCDRHPLQQPAPARTRKTSVTVAFRAAGCCAVGEICALLNSQRALKP